MEAKFKFFWGIMGDLFFGAAGITALFPNVILDIHNILKIGDEFIVLLTRAVILLGVCIWVLKRWKQYKKM